MSPRSAFVWLSCVLILTTASVAASAATAAAAPATQTGIVLDRLSLDERRQWRSIERVVTAAGPGGAPRHPTLRGLWEWAVASGHAIYIELSSPDCASAAMAGKFLIERVNPEGRHVGVIRLCLANIDPSHGSGTPAKGFVRFAGLGRNERYAEVLGHELAHAAYDFASPERARMIMEHVETVSAQFMSHRAQRGNEPLALALRQRIAERDALLEELETHADAIELLVWREFVRGR